MRILILNERDPQHPAAGGAETHVQEIFRRLVARGHAVTIRVSAFAGGAPQTEIDGIRFERAGRVPFSYARAARACARATRRGDVDVVVECLNKLPFLAPVYSARPVLGLCHHLFGTTAFQQASWPVAALVWGAERAIPLAYRHTPIVAISPSTRDDLLARGVDADRIEVQLPGIRAPRIAPEAIARRAPLVVYVGRLEAYKRIDLLLEAMARVCGSRPEAELAVIGRGRERARLERRAAALGLGTRVVFTGFLSDNERDRWLARARVCVCPSAREGFGLTVIEANALGTPNVVADVPGLRDAVRPGETGLLFADRDIAQLTAHVESLLADDALSERLSGAALTWSRRFDWDRAADAMERALERVAGAG